jgi:hypothetical protein
MIIPNARVAPRHPPAAPVALLVRLLDTDAFLHVLYRPDVPAKVVDAAFWHWRWRQDGESRRMTPHPTPDPSGMEKHQDVA